MQHNFTVCCHQIIFTFQTRKHQRKKQKDYNLLKINQHCLALTVNLFASLTSWEEKALHL
jgi:hypothetical protein